MTTFPDEGRLLLPEEGEACRSPTLQGGRKRKPYALDAAAAA